MRVSFFLVFILLSNILSGKTYYVSPTGNDSNPGSIEKPWATWKQAFNFAWAGDTVYFRGGVYREEAPLLIKNSGTSSNPIVFINYPGEEPVMDCGWYRPTGIYNQVIYAEKKSYIDFIGLTVRNVLQPGGDYGVGIMGFYFFDGTGVRAINCKAHNVSGIGFMSAFKDSDGSHYFINCDAYNVIDSLSPPGFVGGRGTGFRSSNSWTLLGHTHFKGCRAWNCSDQGFSLSSDAYKEADECWSFNNGWGEAGDGHGFKLGWYEKSSSEVRCVMSNCIAAYNDYSGAVTNDLNYENVGHMNIFNNIFFNNGNDNRYVTAFGLWISETQSPDSEELKRVFKNNISYKNKTGPVSISKDAQYTHVRNSWDTPPGIQITDADFVTLDSTGLAGPRRPDGSLPELDLLKLAPTSKLIDAGTNVGLPYSGSAPDLGPYEYITEGSSMNPIVTITSPANNSEYNQPASITINVNAYDSDGTISKVEFYNGNLKIGEKTSAPWTFIWSSVSGGIYSITAIAVDNTGTKATSAPVSIKVNKPPVVSISSPVTGSTFVAPASIAITAYASDPDGTINKVEFYSGSVKLAEKTASPWTYTWSNVPGGSYSLIVIATDNSGLKKTSEAVTLKVNKPPVISISSPATGSIFTQPANINLTASASDSDGSISKVEFFYGTVKLGEITSSPWTYTWTNVPAGTHSITAVATDNSDSKTTSVAVVATVNIPGNQIPVVHISAPVSGSIFTAAAEIVIAASASDSDGSISKVEFYNGKTKLGEVTSSPWTLIWRNVPAGNYSLTAVATDNSGIDKTSSAITVFVNNPPEITLINPLKGGEYEVHSDIVIEAVASDPDGTIDKVEFYNDKTKIATLTSGPFIYTLKDVSEGTYIITAVATDNLNAVTYSAAVEIVIETDTHYDSSSEILSLFPNPNNGDFTISLVEPMQGESTQVSICSLDGRIIHKSTILQSELTKQFSLPNLYPGHYIMILTGDNIVVTKSFIKK